MSLDNQLAQVHKASIATAIQYLCTHAETYYEGVRRAAHLAGARPEMFLLRAVFALDLTRVATPRGGAIPLSSLPNAGHEAPRLRRAVPQLFSNLEPSFQETLQRLVSTIDVHRQFVCWITVEGEGMATHDMGRSVHASCVIDALDHRPTWVGHLGGRIGSGGDNMVPPNQFVTTPEGRVIPNFNGGGNSNSNNRQQQQQQQQQQYHQNQQNGNNYHQDPYQNQNQQQQFQQQNSNQNYGNNNNNNNMSQNSSFGSPWSDASQNGGNNNQQQQQQYQNNNNANTPNQQQQQDQYGQVLSALRNGNNNSAQKQQPHSSSSSTTGATPNSAAKASRYFAAADSNNSADHHHNKFAHKAIDASKSSSKPGEIPKTLDLSQLDKIDEFLAVSHMCTKASTKCLEHIQTFNLRLDELHTYTSSLQDKFDGSRNVAKDLDQAVELLMHKLQSTEKQMLLLESPKPITQMDLKRKEEEQQKEMERKIQEKAKEEVEKTLLLQRAMMKTSSSETEPVKVMSIEEVQRQEELIARKQAELEAEKKEKLAAQAAQGSMRKTPSGDVFSRLEECPYCDQPGTRFCANSGRRHETEEERSERRWKHLFRQMSLMSSFVSTARLSKKNSCVNDGGIELLL